MSNFDACFHRFIGPFIKWSLVGITVLLLIFIIAINVFSGLFVGKEYALQAFFDKLRVPMTIHYQKWNDCQLRYIQTGLDSDSADLLFFIHGAPGNLDNFKEYLADQDLRKNFKMVSMDRPGYGGSCAGKAVIDLKIQSEAAFSILSTLEFRRAFIVSHSYGCPVAGKLAADHPDKINGIVMCAPLNDPDSEPMEWYSQIANWKLSRALMPDFIDVATDEKMTHAEELSKIKKDWKKIQAHVLHIHGEDDGLAPFEDNIRFSKENISSDLLSIYSEAQMGHLNIWINAGTVKKEILKFIDSILL